MSTTLPLLTLPKGSERCVLLLGFIFPSKALLPVTRGLVGSSGILTSGENVAGVSGVDGS